MNSDVVVWAGWPEVDGRDQKTPNKDLLHDPRRRGLLNATKEASIDVVIRFYKGTITRGMGREGHLSDFGYWIWETESPKTEVQVSIAFREGRIELITAYPRRTSRTRVIIR